LAQWLDRVDRRDPEPQPPPHDAPTSPAPPIQRLIVRGPTRRLHLAANRSVTLEVRQFGSLWAVACTSPCDRELPVSADYRVIGDDVRSSHAFTFTPPPGETVDLIVQAAPAWYKGVGIGLVVTGSLALPPAILVDILFFAVSSLPNSCELGCNYNGLVALALGLTFGGLGALFTGIAFLGNTTTVTQRGPVLRGLESGWLRQPLRLDSVTLGAPTPRSTNLPIYSWTF
jgi:hypothetical protein